MKKFMLLIANLLIYISVFSQYITGIIIEDKNKKPIPYCNVYISGNDDVGVVSDENGQFILNYKVQQNDTLIISNIAYKNVSIPLNNRNINEINLGTISLVESIYILPEVSILLKQDKIVEKGVYKKKFLLNMRNYQMTMDGQEIISVLIENDFKQNQEAYLKSVKYYIKDNSTTGYLFRVHVYGVSLTQLEPGEELLKVNIIKRYPNTYGWVEIDLKDYNIKMPDNGLFVGIEYIDEPLKKSFLNSNGKSCLTNLNDSIGVIGKIIHISKIEKEKLKRDNKSGVLYSDSILYVQATEYRRNEHLTWTKNTSFSKKWRRNKPYIKNHQTDNACISATFYVYKKKK